MTVFKLPDLGEGLPEAEIITWHIEVGDDVRQGDLLVSVETAKAIVDIPSPCSGKVRRLFGQPGDIIPTGEPLVELQGEGEQPPAQPTSRADAGTVVGEVTVGRQVLRERPTAIGTAGFGVRAVPAVRALAQKLNVDLSVVTPSGKDGSISAADVQRVARILAQAGPLAPLRGVRRAMARTLSRANAEVVAVTVSDDADIHAWSKGEDVTLRLVRAIVAGCQAEPSLNAWYDSHSIGRRVLAKIDLAIAVDTLEGLFVPVLRDIANRSTEDLRRGLNALKESVRQRKIPPEEMRGYSFTLSNFGTLAGRYADPIVVPPTVAILGAGRIRDRVVAVDGQPAVRRTLPVSLTVDHRAVTGGEAARFLAVLIRDLEQP
jgi:pyruvate dehydrogenase E2 component (dihydrolipoamide acetyltransferase)